MTHNTNKIINIFIDFIKEELNNPDVKNKLVRPTIIYLLYYIIPFMVLFLLLNFITTILAVFLVYYIKITKK
jgi:hypothetical protein